ncbi:MAG: hypothetical protein US68_C0029G0008, partial [Candidatus Shapirobacteria bacterium GW2011_GWE1_38_10]
VSEGGQLDYQLFHQQTVFFIRNFLTRYFNYFSPKFLLTDADWRNPGNSAPYTGVLLIPSILFLTIGVFRTLIIKPKNKTDKYFLYWLFLAPLPSALTQDLIYATRAMSFSIPLCYFIAVGIETSVKKYQNALLKTLIIILYLISLIYYLDLYHNHMLKHKPEDWSYGVEQAVDYINKFGENRSIYFTPFYSQPYIYYLFYNKYSPQRYHSQANLITRGQDVGYIKTIDNIIFETPSFSFLQLQSRHVLAIFSYDDAIRQGIDLSLLTPLSPINNISTFYGYKNP